MCVCVCVGAGRPSNRQHVELSQSASNQGDAVFCCVTVGMSVPVPQVKNASEKGWADFTSWVQGKGKDKVEEEEMEEEVEEEEDEEEEELKENKKRQLAEGTALPRNEMKPTLPKPAGGRYGSLGGGATTAHKKPVSAQWSDDWGDWGWGDTSGGSSKKD